MYKIRFFCLSVLPQPGAFLGGGTAFWSHLNRDDSDEKVPEEERPPLPHAVALNPPAGTAIIFGGNVTHAGLPTIGSDGTRHLFVMSFTLRCLLFAFVPPSINLYIDISLLV